MRKPIRLLAVFLCLILLFLTVPTAALADTGDRLGVVDVGNGYTLNVRSGPGVSYSSIKTLNNGAVVTVLDEDQDTSGTVWYQVSFSSSGTTVTGWVCGDYMNVSTVEEDDDFEAYLDSQKFPESYRAGLRLLHSLYPNWKFVAVHTGLDWEDVVEAECVTGRNLVYYSSWKSWIDTTDVDAYGRQIARDGSQWVSASKAIISYSLDPRNFLTDPYIFMFESLSYTEGLYTLSGVENVVKGTFLDSTCTNLEGEEISYAQAFMDAAADSGVNPYHLAARCRMEQGTSGTVLTAGTVSGYYGYYNFYNVGAYTTSTASAVTNGAIYASSGSTYYRPWNTQYKAILGGASILGSGYISKGQDTMYTEKFNVTNTSSGLYYHQYMTSVTAPADESSTIRKGYSDEVLNSTMLFKIPVYENMPATAVEKPTGNGSGTGSDSSSSSQIGSLSGDSDSSSVSGSTSLKVSDVVLTSTSLTVSNGTITALSEGMTVSSLCKALKVANGSLEVYSADGQKLSSSSTTLVGTGTVVRLLDASGEEVASYTAVLYGDLNGDGAITVVDLLREQKHLLNILQLTGAYKMALDTNRDNTVSVTDLLRLQKYLLKTATIQQ